MSKFVFPDFLKAGEVSKAEGGITKREFFSLEILKAKIAKGSYASNEDLVTSSINLTDILIKNLKEE